MESLFQTGLVGHVAVPSEKRILSSCAKRSRAALFLGLAGSLLLTQASAATAPIPNHLRIAALETGDRSEPDPGLRPEPPLAPLDSPYMPRLVGGERYVGIHEYSRWPAQRQQTFLTGVVDGFQLLLSEVDAIYTSESPPRAPGESEPMPHESWSAASLSQRWRFANQTAIWRAGRLFDDEGPMRGANLATVTASIGAYLRDELTVAESTAAIAWRFITREDPVARPQTTGVGGRFIAQANSEVDPEELRTYLAGALEALFTAAMEREAIRKSELPPPLPPGAEPIDYMTWFESDPELRSDLAARLAIGRVSYAVDRGGVMARVGLPALQRAVDRHLESTVRWDYGERPASLAAWQAFVRYEPETGAAE